MVYGLDAILPMEFLLPTLRVAQTLEWNGHEFSDRLDELKKLDETRLRAVAAMYALKRRQKSFHDARIKTKEFKTGDLVLAYTLKQHTSKLKKRGMGPYLIHDISTSGALRLATLDGEQMPNWISGCRVKKYYEPLTLEMLERMHKAKERKRLEAKQIQAAKAEGKAREAKRKMRVMQITGRSKTTSLQPLIRIDSGSLEIPSTALIDT